MTFSGFIIAGLFFCISASKPLDTLSPEKPPVNLFSPYILCTVALQFLGHFVTMATVRKMAIPFVAAWKRWKAITHRGAEELLPDGEFKPNVLNTVVFLLDMAMQRTTPPPICCATSATNLWPLLSSSIALSRLGR